MEKTTNITLWILFLALLAISACKNKPEEFGKKDAIPEDELIDVLTDLHMTDGLLNNPGVREDYFEKDSTENYQDVIAKYGYTKYIVDESINYYFINKPKKLESIYHKVIENLSVIEAKVIQETQKDANINTNLWNGERTYRLPDKGLTNTVKFSIQTTGPGIYTLKARFTIYEDDQSIDPHISIWFWYDDESEEGNIINWDKKVLEKTSRSNVIRLQKELVDPKVTHIKGMLFNHSEQTGHWEKHANISSITLTKKPVQKDSITIQ